MHKFKALAFAVILLASTEISINPVFATSSRCLADVGHPGGCSVPYSDAGLLNSDLDKCNHSDPDLGNLTNTGSDYVLSVSFPGIGLSGHVANSGTYQILVTMNLDCRRWDSYSLQVSLEGSSGDSIPINLETPSLTEQDPTYDTSDYCFLVFSPGSCKFEHFTGNFFTPANLLSSSYSLKIRAKDKPTGTGLPSVDKTITWSSILTTDTVAPIPVVTPLPTIITGTPTPFLIPTSAPNFQVSFVSGQVIIDISTSDASAYYVNYQPTEFNTRFIDATGKTYPVTPPGIWPLSLSGIHDVLNGVPPGLWQVEVSAKNIAGVSPWSTPQLIDTRSVILALPTLMPSPIKVSTRLKTISCVKGKILKKITSVIPKCPVGYAKKSKRV
jgi:hypothetical protein